MNVENPYAGQGAVLLDIGDDVGALVVEMPAALEGVEVEIRPTDGIPGHDHHHGHGHLPHVAVVSRPAGYGVVPSLVFGELQAGRYELYQRPAGEVRLTVDISGGQVALATWPESGD